MTSNKILDKAQHIEFSWTHHALTIIPLLWAGMILGISFLEAPVKFSTPSITREIAFDVGQTVFTAFNFTEWAWLGLFVIALSFHGWSKSLSLFFYILVAILLIQSFWLLPELKYHANQIINNQKIESSFVHTTYIVVECLKLILLIGLGIIKK